MADEFRAGMLGGKCESCNRGHFTSKARCKKLPAGGFLESPFFTSPLLAIARNVTDTTASTITRTTERLVAGCGFIEVDFSRIVGEGKGELNFEDPRRLECVQLSDGLSPRFHLSFRA